MVPRGYKTRRPCAIQPAGYNRAECTYNEGYVSFYKNSNRWYAKGPRPDRKYLGQFDSEAAARAALAAYLEYLQEQPTLSFFVKAINRGQEG